jgi:hypothetical protein
LSTPEACAAFAQTCRAAHSLYQSTALWRGLHRAIWDPPQSTDLGSSPRYNHQEAVKDRRRAANRLEKSNRSRQALPDRDCVPVARALVQTALERPWGRGPSQNEDWLANLLRASPGDEDGAEGILFLAAGYGPRSSSGHFLRSRPNATIFDDYSATARGYQTAVPREVDEATAPDSIVAGRLAELVARLHILATPSPLAFQSPSIRTRAKEIVYTRANWTRHACYGPFQSDGSGRVDWRKVEALAIVAGANFSDARAMGWGRPPRLHRQGGMGQQGGDDSEFGPAVPPRGWSSSRPLSAGPVRFDPEGRDWSGLTSHELVGSYMFLHYPMYIAIQSGTSSLSLEDEDEAVGDCLPMIFELLPQGEWPAEVEQPDLSFEAQDLADEDDDEDDRDWTDGSGSDRDDDDEEEQDSILEEDMVDDLGRPNHLVHSIDSLLSAGSSSSLRQGPVHNEYQPAVPISRSSSSSIPVNRSFSSVAQDEVDNLHPTLQTATESLSATSPSPGTDFLAHAGVQAPGHSPPPQTEVEHPPPPSNLPNTRLRPLPDSVPHPTYPTLAFRGVPGSLKYAEPDRIPAQRPGTAELYHPDARTFRGTIEWLPDDQAAKVTLVVRYGGEDQWVM